MSEINTSNDETDLETLGQSLYKADICVNVEQRGVCTSYKNPLE